MALGYSGSLASNREILMAGFTESDRAGKPRVAYVPPAVTTYRVAPDVAEAFIKEAEVHRTRGKTGGEDAEKENDPGQARAASPPSR